MARRKLYEKIIAAALCVLLCAGAFLNVYAARESTGNPVKDTFQDFLDTSRRLEELKNQTDPPTEATVPTEPPTGIPVESVVFTTPGLIYLYPGQTYDLDVLVLPENAADRSVTFESSGKSIAAVDGNGQITAKPMEPRRLLPQAIMAKPRYARLRSSNVPTASRFQARPIPSAKEKASAFPSGLPRRTLM